MNRSTPLADEISSAVTAISRPSLRVGLLVLALAWFAPSRTAPAVSPPPDGGYPGSNTAEGTDALFSNTTGVSNTANGFAALLNNTTGSSNTANGFAALGSNSTGNNNTASGDSALQNNTTGNNNTANGALALESNTTGGLNTANGVAALASNTTGTNNTANGAFTLESNTTGIDNTATGSAALSGNTTGDFNTASGFDALLSNTTGSNDTATGVNALLENTTGTDNTGNGANALYNNTTGIDNTATGSAALTRNTTGNYNTASGVNALFYNVVGHDNTGEGFQALLNAKGSNNIGIGSNAGANLSNGSNNIDIGNLGVAGESSKIRIGKQGTQKNTYIAGIYGATVANGVAVRIDSTGHLGTLTSSARFKEAIKPMDKASEAILALNPVTFRYKHELDPEGIPQFGLVAEQVEKVNPDLVVRDEEGKVMTVRYEAVNAMLLNEFLKAHRKLEEQEAIITRLESKLANREVAAEQQQKQIDALTTAVQKVNDRRESTKPAAQVVANEQ